MTYQVHANFKDSPVSKLENFDDLWALGDPIVIEKNLRELLPQAREFQDSSIYLQILSQVALTQALQQKFDEAHRTLNDAEQLLTPEQDLARVRILLERGRIFQQAEEIVKAKPLFLASYELSSKNHFDYHTINAAHMIAIIEDRVDEKIKWNQLAIELAQKTDDSNASRWVGSLYNNLGHNYMEAVDFGKALDVFSHALKIREQEAYVPNIRVAKWQVAKALRLLGRLNEAEAILCPLLAEYDILSKNNNLDLPFEMFKLLRGWVYEELAEIYHAKASSYAIFAYDDLSKNSMFNKTESKRLERLKQIQQLTVDCI